MKPKFFVFALTALMVACVQPSPSIFDLANDALIGSNSRVVSLEITPRAAKIRLSGIFSEELQSKVITAVEKHLLGKTKALEFQWEQRNLAQVRPQAYCSGAARVVYPNPRAKPSGISGAKIMLNPGHGLTQLVGGTWVYQRPIPPSSGALLHEDPNNLSMSIPIQTALSNAGAVVSSTRNLDVLAGIGASGQEKWKEAARHHVQALGVPDHVWNSEGNDFENDCNKGRDIRVRPFYANFLGVDALVSIHSNADPSSATRGLRVYYNTTAFTPDIPQNSLLQSADLAVKLTNSALAAIQQDRPELGWTATLPIGSEDYGENGFAKMPAVIIEVGFHTNSTDAAAMQETSFRNALARGIKNGLEQFFGATSSEPAYPAAPVALEPGSGTAPGIEVTGDTITFRWNGVQNATGYGFYMSKAPYGAANLIINREDIPASSRSISYSVSDLKALSGGNLNLKWNMTAFQNTSNGAFSNSLFLTLPNAVVPPSIPAGLTVAMSSNGRMFLAWNEVTTATSYGFSASLNGQPLTIAQTVPKGAQPQAAAVAVFEQNPSNPALVGQSVCFAIRANGVSGSSGFSSSACVPYAYYSSVSLQQNGNELPRLLIQIP